MWTVPLRGGSNLLKKEYHLEVPMWQFHVTKPQFELALCIVESWVNSIVKAEKLSPISETLLHSVFSADQGAFTMQPELHFRLSNIELAFCETVNVLGASGSVGAISASLKSTADSGANEVTPLIEGPSDTSELYKRNLFKSTHLQENIVESTGPVLSFTLQLAQAVLRSGESTQEGQSLPFGDYVTGLVLFHLKGITLNLDPFFYKWISYQSPSPNVSPLHREDRERTKSTRHQSLTRTPSGTTPRKKSFARGFGSVVSQAKEEKLVTSKQEGAKKQTQANNSTFETVDGRKAFESWLYDKLPFITSTELQIEIKSMVVFMPEKHIVHSIKSSDIALNYSVQSLKKSNNSFPPTLVVCFPSFKLHSANHEPMSVRQSLPVNTCHRDMTRRETLPWTLQAENLAVYSVHAKNSSSLTSGDHLPVVRYVLSTVSCTAVLASARTSSGPGSPHFSPTQLFKPGSTGGRRFSTLGFCVHTDLQPVEISCSRKQLHLLANLVQSLPIFSISRQTSPTSTDATTGVPSTTPPAAAPDPQRTNSVSSSSGVEQVESESLKSESVSSAAYSQIQQSLNSIRISLWLQWTLPRVIVNLYSRSGADNSAVCISADLEDLTASVDYMETMLHMHFKVGAFNVSHFTQSSDGSWVHGRFNGVLLSCNDIISSKSLLTTSSRRSYSGRREISGQGPRGFLTVMYKRSSLHLKRRTSSSDKSGKEEDCFKDQHEIRVNIQPFDVVLWTPAVLAALETVDLSLLEKFRVLVPMESDAEKADEGSLLRDQQNDKRDCSTVNVELLPLLFVDMRNLRLFIPCEAGAGKSVEGMKTVNYPEDMTVIQLSTVSASPHPDNPNSRAVLNREFYDKFLKFGRSSRQALGYDIHDVQYQIDLCGFGMWSGSWVQLCGSVRNEEGLERVGVLVDQNPALEWNTQMWHGTEEVHVTPIISGSDFRVVLAPAISVIRQSTVNGAALAESVPVCGWSLEFNVVTDVDCFLNKNQIQLLQTLSAENLKVFSKSSLGMSPMEVDIEGTKSNLVPSSAEGIRGSPGRIDSGFESMPTQTTANFGTQKRDITKFKVGNFDDNIENGTGIETEAPWEIFVTGRKLSVSVYSKIHRDDKPTDNEVLPAKPSLPGRCKPAMIKPVLRVELVHPALVMNTHSTSPRIQVSCFDVNVAGVSSSIGSLFKKLPDAHDYSVQWVKSGAGIPDQHSGILPSLLTVDVTEFLCGPAEVSVEIGRSVYVNLNIENVEELTHFLDGLVLSYGETSVGPKDSQIGPTARTLFMSSFALCTSDIVLQLEAPAIRSNPKLLGSVVGIEAKACFSPNKQGNVSRVDTKLQLHGVSLATSIHDRSRPLICPFSCSIDLEAIWAPHSRDLMAQSGYGFPQLYVFVEASCVQISVGQEHVTCLKLLSDLAEEFTSPSTANEQPAGTGTRKTDRTDPIALFESYDDIRAGAFRYVTAPAELDMHHPEPWEIVFSSDFSDRPPTMTWKYPEPRALSAVELVPLPLSSPVLVNTLNMGEEYKVPCVLRYWDPAQKCYISYKDFHLSENNSSSIPFPDPSTADPSEVIVAAEWQMVVDVTVDIEYPDDGSFDGDSTVYSYASPYHSLLAAASLAASVKVNSVVRPALNPALSAHISVNMLEVKFSNHLHAIGQAVPQYLAGFTMDPSLPTDQEFLLLTVEGLSSVVKDVGGEGGFLHVQAEWNCQAQVLDYGDLTYRPLLSPFDVELTLALYHEEEQEIIRLQKDPASPPVWLEVGLEVGSVLTHVSQSTIHTIVLSTTAWGQAGSRDVDRIIFNHYIICNDTHEALRFGQVHTDESLLLGSRQTHAYSWRTPHTVKESPKLHLCIETEGDWRWSEPFDIDTVGVCSRTIHHRLHSATLFIEVKQLSGMQKQILIRGSHIIVSRLSIDVDLQILTNPSIDSDQSSKARYQVLEDVSLPANTTLPSYVISHGGLAGMRIRIPNGTTWSEVLPLEHLEGNSEVQHRIVQLLGVKDFQTFYLWYNVEKAEPYDQIKVALSPLFLMRSHLPEPVLMNVLTAKTNSSSVLQLQGRAHEQQLYNLVPNSWHHLTFQFSGSSQWSSPSVPLNTTLIELANRVTSDSTSEEETPLADRWPYCKDSQLFRRADIALEEKPESSLVKKLSIAGQVIRDEKQPLENPETEPQGIRNNSSPVPAIEVQCRVIKRWPHLSTLLVEILPWCLLINNTTAHLLLRDLERDITLNLPSGSVVAPHKIKGKIQFGSSLEGKSPSWSEALLLPAVIRSSRQQSDEDDAFSVPVAFVLASGDVRGVRWSITSRLFRGIEIVILEHRFQVINNVGRPLVAHPLLLPAGRKVTSDGLNRDTLILLPSDPDQATPLSVWDVPSSTAVVLDQESNPSFSTQTLPILFLALKDKETTRNNFLWSRAVSITPEVTRQSFAVPVDKRSTLPVVVTSHVANGIVYVVFALDPVPRMLLQNDCPFTLQFGQAIPPQSPSSVGGSEKIVVVEQSQDIGDIPEVAAFCSTHYELPVMREWFATASEVQRLPEFHIQALYDVNVAQLSEEEGEQGEVACEVTTKVPQGWSKGFDLNSSGELSITLPGRGQVLIDISRERLCTCVKIQPCEKASLDSSTLQDISPPRSFINADLFVCQFSMTIIDEVTSFRNPYEVMRLTAEGLALTHSIDDRFKDCDRACRELTIRIGSFQVDNQLKGDTYEFSAILIPNNTPWSSRKAPLPRRQSTRSRVKPLAIVRCRYEQTGSGSDVFLRCLDLSLEPVTLYLEDSFLYRVGDMLASFLPPLLYFAETTSTPLSKVLDVTQSTIHPFSVGELNIAPVTLNVTLHASVKLFVSVDDSPLSLGRFNLSPVFLPSSALIQKLTYHYSTAALFKAGWVLGSLELLGNPAGLVRSFGQGVADFFYLPYDGLTRGPGAFVSGMSRGMSSFVKHLSTGTLTSITSLASSMARNLDRLSMDGEHLRLLEEQRCRRPKKVLTGLSQGLGGFGLSLLGAVAGIVDQPLQGIQRANDVREAASGVITGMGKGLIGVVTKPLGGAMELVNQTGQGILQGAGLTQLPSRLFTPEDGLEYCVRNSHLKYFWKMLHNQSETDLLLHFDATVVIPSGHDYEGAILLTRDTLFIVGLEADAIQQSLFLRDIDLKEDEDDNRNVSIVNQSIITKEEDDENVGTHGSGDSDRLRQFLRDARAQALRQISSRDTSYSDFSCAAQKFVLTVDPMLRRTLVVQFHAAKRNCGFQS
ncbi:intermembrane lipid transfer protein VPS13B-like isoform X2 [Montipora foliosa]|uniref:intermembrane lipid transfer protein VPS13B-like isoform X2 n=1 Tax=Montipora foliosa TaxID=591990 RepID=UPI0035F1A2B1